MICSFTFPLYSVAIPGTFSIKNALGLKCFTAWTTATYNLFLESLISLEPVKLNPWHGGPAIITSILLPFKLFSISLIADSSSKRSALSATESLRLCLYVLSAGSSKSTPIKILKPACLNPWLNPPAPENKSTTLYLRIRILL